MNFRQALAYFTEYLRTTKNIDPDLELAIEAAIPALREVLGLGFTGEPNISHLRPPRGRKEE